MKQIKTLLAAAVLAGAGTASALDITADFSLLGNVYQDSSGLLYGTGGAGLTDVTNIFRSNVNTAINYWENAILLPWSQTISFSLADLSSSSAVGDSLITSFSADNRPATTRIRVDAGNVPFYMDATPGDDLEFGMTSSTALLGGAAVNVSRFGSATAPEASNGYDFLSLVLHEVEHSVGFSAGTVRWGNVVTGNTLTVPTSVSGLSSSFNIPLIGTHIDGTTQNGLFNDTSIALPGFNSGQRALLSAVDILAVCTIAGCGPDQFNLSPSAIPEPASLLMLSAGGLLLAGTARRQRKAA